jgi:hypothetical protein
MAKLTKEERLELLRRKEQCEDLLKARMACKNHTYPTTRREFLEAGLIGFAASITLPSLIPSLLTKAYAQSGPNCQTTTTIDDLPGFMTINLAGGAGLMGQVQYLQLDGSPLSSYRTHGVGANPQTEALMGATFFSSSGFVQGLKAVLEGKNQLNVLDKTQLIAVPCTNQDDTPANTSELDISGLILAIGKRGRFFQNTGTTGDNPGKVRNAPALLAPPVALRVQRIQDLRNAVELSGSLGNLSAQQSTRLAKFISRLSEAQSRRLAMETKNGSDLKSVIDCATLENEKLIQNGVAGLDPTQDESMRNIWDIATNNAGNSLNGGDAENVGTRVVAAALSQVTMNGLSGPVGISLGGYDYHSGTSRATANTRDTNFGRLIGRILMTANYLGKKMAIYVTTDGSVSTPNADNSLTADWQGDSQSRGSFWLILFDPAGRPSLNDNSMGGPNWQIGGYTQNQTVNTSFFTGGSAALAAGSLALNYALFAGQSSKIGSIFGGRYSSQQIDLISRARS